VSDDVSGKNTDFDDLNRELAGISGNRAARFLSNVDRLENTRGEKRRSRDNAAQTQLDLLMMNSAFADAYQAAAKAADDVQGLLDQRRMQLAQNFEHLEAVIENFEESTVKLTDGRAVFRDEQGRLVDADKNALTLAEIASITDLDAVADYEPYGQAKDALTAARKRQNTYDGYQDRIDNARNGLKNPPDQDTVGDIQRDFDELRRELGRIDSPRSAFENAADQKAETAVQNLDLNAEMPTR